MYIRICIYIYIYIYRERYIVALRGVVALRRAVLRCVLLHCAALPGTVLDRMGRSQRRV